LDLWPGENLCILGPNGWGKTTLLKLIVTLLIPAQGRNFVQGHNSRVGDRLHRQRQGRGTGIEASDPAAQAAVWGQGAQPMSLLAEGDMPQPEKDVGAARGHLSLGGGVEGLKE
jgi:energy-coupling factor transporter ATP-binding protein EcfA2